MTGNYRVVFYRDSRGEVPFRVFLDGRSDAVRNKFLWLAKLLEMYGPNLKRPYSDQLRDGIRELRARVSGNSYRALYFFMIGRVIIVTHAFIKKTDAVSAAEIDRAIRYRHDLEDRMRRGEYEL